MIFLFFLKKFRDISLGSRLHLGLTQLSPMQLSRVDATQG